jgi:hypothetical protein
MPKNWQIRVKSHKSGLNISSFEALLSEINNVLLKPTTHPF